MLAGLEVRGWLVATPHGHAFDLSPDGERALAAVALDVAPLRRACLDGTGRRPQLAGAVGAAMRDALLQRDGSCGVLAGPVRHRARSCPRGWAWTG